MPDIFSGIAFIGLGAFMLSEVLIHRIIWLVLFIITTAMRYSNLIVGAGVAGRSIIRYQIIIAVAE